MMGPVPSLMRRPAPRPDRLLTFRALRLRTGYEKMMIRLRDRDETPAPRRGGHVAITAVQPAHDPKVTVMPGTRVINAMPGIPTPQAPYLDHFEMTPKLRARAFFRSVHLGGKELFGGHTIEKPYFEKRWQRVLHRIFPGGALQAAFAAVKPDPAAEAIPSGPNDRRIDAREWMPNVRFEKGEPAYPVDPAFDGDGDVTNNRDHYRAGKTDGNQEVTFFVNARQKGPYTVVQYWSYHAFNAFINYHKNDMEMFSVYLQPDAQGRLTPAYLQTDWHGAFTMTPWHQLQTDASGRPTVTFDRGSHEARPLRRQDKLPAGTTLRPEGLWEDKHGQRPATFHLKGDDPLVLGLEAVTPLKAGLDPRDAWYPGGNWMFGFHYDETAVASGPRARVIWFNPVDPSSFGYGTAVNGQVLPLAAQAQDRRIGSNGGG
jgi:hypothetical protein